MSGMALLAMRPRSPSSVGTVRQPSTRQALLGGGVLHDGAGLDGVVGVGGQEDEADRVAAGVGQREPGRLGGGRQEAVRDLHQDAGAVAGVDLGPGGAAVGQALQDGQAAVDDVVVGTAVADRPPCRHHRRRARMPGRRGQWPSASFRVRRS